MREKLHQTLLSVCCVVGSQCTISSAVLSQLEDTFSLTRHELEIAALESGVVPLRYLRNMGTIGIHGQLALLRSRVAVVGLGGLGGYVLEGLARAGVGHIVAIDGDRFEEHNLNRQLLSCDRLLGASKAQAAADRVALINPAVNVKPLATHVSSDNAPRLLASADAIVDALDNLPDRLTLQAAAQILNKPLVHGAIAGFLGQVLTIMPGDVGLRALYPKDDVPEHGLEQSLGTPPATPMMIAALQVQETIKLLTGTGEILRNRLLLIDTGTGDVQKIELEAISD